MTLHEQPLARTASAYLACEWCGRSIRKGHAMLVLPRAAGEVCGDCVRRAFALFKAADETVVVLGTSTVLPVSDRMSM